MKRVFTLVIAAGLMMVGKANAQCTLNASANPYNICVGDSTLLTAQATIPGNYYTFDFNNQSLPPGWSVTGGATFSTTPACAAPTLDNSAFYWSSTATSTPIIETADLDVSAGGTINYEFRFAPNSGSSPCETADQYNEGVALEYSTNGGASWTLIVYHCSVPSGGPWAFVGGYAQTLTTVPVSTTPGNGNGSCGIYDNWAPYVIPIPSAAQTTATRFRWRQPNSSGSCCDNWGLDNINVAAQPNLYYEWSNNLNGFNANSQYLTNLTADTCLLVQVTDTTSGTTCLDTVCISVFQLPTLSMSYSNPFCLGDQVVLDATLSDPSVSSYQWDLNNDGTYEITSANPVYTVSGMFTTAGNYVISFQGVTPGGCKSSLDTIVNMYNNPTVGLNVTDPTICDYSNASMNALAFVFNGPGQSTSVNNYEWDLNYDGIVDSTGSSLTAMNYHFPGPGTYPVVVNVTTSVGCERTDTVTVTVVSAPSGNIVAPQVCGNVPANFSFTNTAGGPVTTYAWDFGVLSTTTDVSANSAPSYQYPQPGTYSVILIASNSESCRDTFMQLISINPLPAGDITNTAVCEQIDETFIFNQTSADNIVNYTWNFPNGNPSVSTDSVPVVNFTPGGPTNISLIIENQYGCLDTITKLFTVYPTPTADFGVYPICISRFTFDPLVTPDDNTVSIDWDLGDGFILNNTDTSLFNHIYSEPGDYSATLIITTQEGCIDSVTQNVHVDDTMMIIMPNVLVQTSTMGNDVVDLNNLNPGVDLCIDYTYTVFDRWGVQVFERHNDPYNPDMSCGNCFKGKASNGAVLTPGVYFYVIKGNYEILKSGSITIFE